MHPGRLSLLLATLNRPFGHVTLVTRQSALLPSTYPSSFSSCLVGDLGVSHHIMSVEIGSDTDATTNIYIGIGHILLHCRLVLVWRMFIVRLPFFFLLCGSIYK